MTPPADPAVIVTTAPARTSKETRREQRRRMNVERARRFFALAALEPRLAVLADEVARLRRTYGREHGCCANRLWRGHNGIKWMMARLVGWHAEGEHPELRTASAYSDAYDFLWDLLPNCRHEWPFCSSAKDHEKFVRVKLEQISDKIGFEPPPEIAWPANAVIVGERPR
jgi:hypothetical protein